ncbi:class I SAM-dependent methyltransferase [Mycobacteroides abscessus]|uniref:class I SAM-dependent methyltransferase n=1 Tax=Mycobacteroides abscessus TaxID=36809 RepID=UPI001041DC8C|nr:methyltransferase domain-containing protein [Mycobacteroides abscessus]
MTAAAYYWLQGAISDTKSKIDALNSTMWSPEASNIHRQNLIEAYTSNLHVLQRLEAQVEPSVDVATLYRASKNSSTENDYGDFSFYLERDWSGHDGAECQIRVIECALDYALEQANAEYDSLAVLGAGMGRFAIDYSKLFDRSVAFDSSLTMALAYKLASTLPFSYYDIRRRNSLTPAGQLQKFMTISQAAPRAHSGICPLTYIVADARRMPITSGEISVVLSVFFTDVVPLRTLLREVRRILKDGGIFVHFGPLHFHFNDARSLISVEEIRDVLVWSGFEIVHEDWVDTREHRKPAGLFSYMFHNWCFAARKLASHTFLPDSVLRFSPGVSLDSQILFQADGTRSVSATVVSEWSDRIKVDEILMDVLNQLDGIRSLSECIMQTTQKHPAMDTTAVHKSLSELVYSGVLVIEQ